MMDPGVSATRPELITKPNCSTKLQPNVWLAHALIFLFSLALKDVGSTRPYQRWSKTLIDLFNLWHWEICVTYALNAHLGFSGCMIGHFHFRIMQTFGTFFADDIFFKPNCAVRVKTSTIDSESMWDVSWTGHHLSFFSGCLLVRPVRTWCTSHCAQHCGTWNQEVWNFAISLNVRRKNWNLAWESGDWSLNTTRRLRTSTGSFTATHKVTILVSELRTRKIMGIGSRQLATPMRW